MLKENSALVVRGHRVLDLCLTVAAFVGAYFIKKDVLPLPFRGLLTDPNYYEGTLTSDFCSPTSGVAWSGFTAFFRSRRGWGNCQCRDFRDAARGRVR